MEVINHKSKYRSFLDDPNWPKKGESTYCGEIAKGNGNVVGRWKLVNCEECKKLKGKIYKSQAGKYSKDGDPIE
jgi:hypothetical protein